MASKLDTEENNAALARGNLMSVKQALDVGLTENEIKKLIKMTNEKHNLTKREKDIVKNALEKATKKRNELRRQLMQKQALTFDPNMFDDGAGADILMPEQVQSDEARNLTASPLPTAAALEEARTSPFEPMDIDENDENDDVDMIGGKRKRKRRKRKTKRRKRKTKKRKGGRYLACLCKKKRRSTGGKKRRRRKTRRRKK